MPGRNQSGVRRFDALVLRLSYRLRLGPLGQATRRTNPYLKTKKRELESHLHRSTPLRTALGSYYTLSFHTIPHKRPLLNLLGTFPPLLVPLTT